MGIPLIGNGFTPQGAFPVDTRYLQGTVADRDALPGAAVEEGLQVYVSDNDTLYIYRGTTGTNVANNWHAIESSGISNLSSFNTNNLVEGTNNLYYTDARVAANSAVVANTAKRSYPQADETKLDGIQTGAQVNVGVEYTQTEKTKLSGIEANATADQTAGQIKVAYESNSNTNEFTDTEKAKLDGLVPVTANPGGTGNANLNTIEIDGINYNIAGSSGGGNTINSSTVVTVASPVLGIEDTEDSIDAAFTRTINLPSFPGFTLTALTVDDLDDNQNLSAAASVTDNDGNGQITLSTSAALTAEFTSRIRVTATYDNPDATSVEVAQDFSTTGYLPWYTTGLATEPSAALANGVNTRIARRINPNDADNNWFIGEFTPTNGYVVINAPSSIDFANLNLSIGHVMFFTASELTGAASPGYTSWCIGDGNSTTSHVAITVGNLPANTGNGIPGERGPQGLPGMDGTGVDQATQDAIAANTAKVGISTTQASAITANTAKVGISTTQGTDIGLNNTHRATTTGNPHSVTAAEVGANRQMAISGTNFTTLTNPNEINVSGSSVSLSNDMGGGVEISIDHIPISDDSGNTVVDTNTFVNLDSIRFASSTLALDGTDTSTRRLIVTPTSTQASIVAAITDDPAFRTSIGLGNVDDTSDAAKPVSTATQTALNAKQDVIQNEISRIEMPAMGTFTLLDRQEVEIPDGPVGTRVLKNISGEDRQGRRNADGTFEFADASGTLESIAMATSGNDPDYELTISGNFTPDNQVGSLSGNNTNLSTVGVVPVTENTGTILTGWTTAHSSVTNNFRVIIAPSTTADSNTDIVGSDRVIISANGVRQFATLGTGGITTNSLEGTFDTVTGADRLTGIVSVQRVVDATRYVNSPITVQGSDTVISGGVNLPDVVSGTLGTANTVLGRDASGNLIETVVMGGPGGGRTEAEVNTQINAIRTSSTVLTFPDGNTFNAGSTSSTPVTRAPQPVWAGSNGSITSVTFSSTGFVVYTNVDIEQDIQLDNLGTFASGDLTIPAGTYEISTGVIIDQSGVATNQRVGLAAGFRYSSASVSATNDMGGEGGYIRNFSSFSNDADAHHIRIMTFTEETTIRPVYGARPQSTSLPVFSIPANGLQLRVKRLDQATVGGTTGGGSTHITDVDAATITSTPTADATISPVNGSYTILDTQHGSTAAAIPLGSIFRMVTSATGVTPLAFQVFRVVERITNGLVALPNTAGADHGDARILTTEDLEFVSRDHILINSDVETTGSAHFENLLTVGGDAFVEDDLDVDNIHLRGGVNFPDGTRQTTAGGSGLAQASTISQTFDVYVGVDPDPTAPAGSDNNYSINVDLDLGINQTNIPASLITQLVITNSSDTSLDILAQTGFSGIDASEDAITARFITSNNLSISGLYAFVRLGGTFRIQVGLTIPGSYSVVSNELTTQGLRNTGRLTTDVLRSNQCVELDIDPTTVPTPITPGTLSTVGITSGIVTDNSITIQIPFGTIFGGEMFTFEGFPRAGVFVAGAIGGNAVLATRVTMDGVTGIQEFIPAGTLVRTFFTSNNIELRTYDAQRVLVAQPDNMLMGHNDIRITSIPTTDPNITDAIWSDNGYIVKSGRTAVTATVNKATIDTAIGADNANTTEFYNRSGGFSTPPSAGTTTQVEFEEEFTVTTNITLSNPQTVFTSADEATRFIEALPATGSVTVDLNGTGYTFSSVANFARDDEEVNYLTGTGGTVTPAWPTNTTGVTLVADARENLNILRIGGGLQGNQDAANETTLSVNLEDGDVPATIARLSQIPPTQVITSGDEGAVLGLQGELITVGGGTNTEVVPFITTSGDAATQTFVADNVLPFLNTFFTADTFSTSTSRPFITPLSSTTTRSADVTGSGRTVEIPSGTAVTISSTGAIIFAGITGFGSSAQIQNLSVHQNDTTVFHTTQQLDVVGNRTLREDADGHNVIELPFYSAGDEQAFSANFLNTNLSLPQNANVTITETTGVSRDLVGDVKFKFAGATASYLGSDMSVDGINATDVAAVGTVRSHYALVATERYRAFLFTTDAVSTSGLAYEVLNVYDRNQRDPLTVAEATTVLTADELRNAQVYILDCVRDALDLDAQHTAQAISITHRQGAAVTDVPLINDQFFFGSPIVNYDWISERINVGSSEVAIRVFFFAANGAFSVGQGIAINNSADLTGVITVITPGITESLYEMVPSRERFNGTQSAAETLGGLDGAAVDTTVTPNLRYHENTGISILQVGTVANIEQTALTITEANGTSSIKFPQNSVAFEPNATIPSTASPIDLTTLYDGRDYYQFSGTGGGGNVISGGSIPGLNIGTNGNTTTIPDGGVFVKTNGAAETWVVTDSTGSAQVNPIYSTTEYNMGDIASVPGTGPFPGNQVIAWPNGTNVTINVGGTVYGQGNYGTAVDEHLKGTVEVVAGTRANATQLIELFDCSTAVPDASIGAVNVNGITNNAGDIITIRFDLTDDTGYLVTGIAPRAGTASQGIMLLRRLDQVAVGLTAPIYPTAAVGNNMYPTTTAYAAASLVASTTSTLSGTGMFRYNSGSGDNGNWNAITNNPIVT